MFPALSRSARRTAAFVAAAALASVVAHFIHLNGLRDQSYAAIMWSMARFFTILTNLLVAITLGLAAYRRNGVPAPWLAAVTLSIAMTGAVYHALLADLVDYSGLGWWADQGLHTVVPLGCGLWWLIHAPKRWLTYADLPIFALWPAIYVAYALGRGAADGVYPYPFMDLTDLSAAVVAMNLAGMGIAVLLGGVVMVSIGRFADR